MVMFLDEFLKKCSLVVEEEVIMLLGVKDELQKLLDTMGTIKSLLKDAENRKLKEPSIDAWLSKIQDFMYDADDIIDLCRIEGAQLLTDQNSSIFCNFSSVFFSCFTTIPLRHEVGIRIKKLNDRLNKLNEYKKDFKLKKDETNETPQITEVDQTKTSCLVDDYVKGMKEVEVASNELVNLLVTENVNEKCRIFVITGMGGIGKTTLAQNIFNHPLIQSCFDLKAWSCISETYSEIELLKDIIEQAKGNYGNANAKSVLLPCLSRTIASGDSLFLVLDDVWRADVWDDLLRVPVCNPGKPVRVLVTTRYKKIAKDMIAAHIHHVKKLSLDSGWDMICRRLKLDEQVELANNLKDIGFELVKKCRYLPLAIKAICGALRQPHTRDSWKKVLNNKAWFITELPEKFRGAYYVNFIDLPSHLKQCFLYFSLCREDALLFWEEFTRLWIAEGFIIEQQHSLMEDLAKEYFNELVDRNLLHPELFKHNDEWSICKMHDIIRSLALFLSKNENSCGDVNVNTSTTSIKLRRLSVKDKKEEATKILDSVAQQGALRTLLASGSDLVLDDERLRRLLRLRVLDIAKTKIEVLPDSIGNLVHLRYLDLSFTYITTIPESIEHLSCLQFLNIRNCKNLTQLPSGITRLHNLRYLNLSDTPIIFIPEGIRELQQLNHLTGYVVINNDSSNKLKELSALKKMRTLSIYNLVSAHSGANILIDLCHLSDLELHFSSHYRAEPNTKEKTTIEKLFDELEPPQSLEKLKIDGFSGGRFPNWMALSSSERCFPCLTILELAFISSCTELPPLGQLPELKELTIQSAREVKKIGPEFLGGAVHSTTTIVFPKLEQLRIHNMRALEEWYFGALVELNAPSRLTLMPCLHELKITRCPLLKQLPKGLKHSAMKSLHIEESNRLKSLGDLPPQIEELKLVRIPNLQKVCYLPALKHLTIQFVKNAFQTWLLPIRMLEYFPQWLLRLLQQRNLQNDTNEDFLLRLVCPVSVLRRCIRGGPYWDIIKHVPKVIADTKQGHYLLYLKQSSVYETNL